MASGPWFFVQNVTINGVAGLGDRNVVYGVTDFRLIPPFPQLPDPPISSASWVWASVTELGPNGEPHLGDAPMWIGNVAPQDDQSILIRVMSAWPNDLPGQIKLIFWSQV